MIDFVKSIILSNFKVLKAPYKLTFSLTYRCNSRCQICGIWKNKNLNELSLEQIEGFFEKNDFFNWIDLTGGEVFLRDDLVRVCSAIILNCKNLALLHIPTNGILTKTIVAKTKKILELKPRRFIISVSLDGPPSVHDRLRGVRGNWQKAIKTFMELSKIKSKSFEIFFGMTLFGENHSLIEETYQVLKKEIPWIERADIHFNLAHSSFYYGNEKIDLGISREIIRSMDKYVSKRRYKISVVQLLEVKYQKLLLSFIEKNSCPLKCKSLSASLFLDPMGNIFPCAMWANKIGNLKDFKFDLTKVWGLKKVKRIRKEIADEKCPGCWTPCEAYQTILGNLVNVIH
jgi:MoaA/NifB/PqqE/SkfB family radical SAM enzyme